jgi:hypothetical protein
VEASASVAAHPPNRRRRSSAWRGDEHYEPMAGVYYVTVT